MDGSDTQRHEARKAIATVKIAFDAISDPELALDMATILLAEILAGAQAEQRPEISTYLAMQAIMLLEHLKK